MGEGGDGDKKSGWAMDGQVGDSTRRQRGQQPAERRERWVGATTEHTPLLAFLRSWRMGLKGSDLWISFFAVVPRGISQTKLRSGGSPDTARASALLLFVAAKGMSCHGDTGDPL